MQNSPGICTESFRLLLSPTFCDRSDIAVRSDFTVALFCNRNTYIYIYICILEKGLPDSLVSCSMVLEQRQTSHTQYNKKTRESHTSTHITLTQLNNGKHHILVHNTTKRQGSHTPPRTSLSHNQNTNSHTHFDAIKAPPSMPSCRCMVHRPRGCFGRRTNTGRHTRVPPSQRHSKPLAPVVNEGHRRPRVPI